MGSDPDPDSGITIHRGLNPKTLGSRENSRKPSFLLFLCSGAKEAEAEAEAEALDQQRKKATEKPRWRRGGA